MTTIITTAQQADVMSGTFTGVGDVFMVPTLGTVQACGFNLNGVFVATFVIEGTVGGITWDPVTAYSGAGLAISSVTAATPAFIVPVGGYQAIRLRCTVFTSGTPNVVAVVNGGWVPSLASNSVSPAAATSYVLNSLATANNVLAITGAKTIASLNASNVAASIRYLKLYNKATAPVLASDVPVLVIPLAPGSVQSMNVGLGMRFQLGIGLSITGAAADNDTTAIGAAEVKVKIDYY